MVLIQNQNIHMTNTCRCYRLELSVLSEPWAIGSTALVAMIDIHTIVVFANRYADDDSCLKVQPLRFRCVVTPSVAFKTEFHMVRLVVLLFLP